VEKKFKIPRQIVISCEDNDIKFKEQNPRSFFFLNRKPFLHYLIIYYAKQGITNFYLLTENHSKYLENYCKKFNSKYLNIKIIKINQKKTFYENISILSKELDKIFLFSRDNIFQDINLSDFIKIHKRLKRDITLVIGKKYYDYKSNTIRFNVDNGFLIKDIKSKYLSTGLYLINKKIFKNNLSIKEKSFTLFENFFLEKLILRKKISGFINKKQKFIKISNKISISKIKQNKSLLSKNKAVFLDRDGVLNVDYGYVHKIQNLKLEKKIFKILNYYKNKNFIFIIISNQSGIGRKYFTFKKVVQFNNKLLEKFLKKNIRIIDIYFCPHKPSEQCKCRKPKTKMINDSSFLWNIDKKKSLMIGDKLTDYQCSKKARLKFFYKNELEKIF
jgi:D-glycero-D-manno-heptose 1,7-bisphosphate phosphatase